MEEGRYHVLLVTYPARGHINPLLQFAERLASKGIKVTFATTRYTIQSIEVKNVGVESISNGYDDGGFKLAPGAEDYVKSFQEYNGALPLMAPGVPHIDYTDLPSFLADLESQSAYLAMIMEEFTLLEQNDWVFCYSFEELET